jgi:hypothetical protein
MMSNKWWMKKINQFISKEVKLTAKSSLRSLENMNEWKRTQDKNCIVKQYYKEIFNKENYEL